MSHTSPLSRRLRTAAMLAPAALALSCVAASAKTLVYCSEGSPENFYAAVNTTGTSFDATTQVYNNLVEFERGGTKVVPGLAESWTISPDGLTYTLKLHEGIKFHPHLGRHHATRITMGAARNGAGEGDWLCEGH